MNKCQLYEYIMKNIAKEVKQTLNEAYWFDNPGTLTLSSEDLKEFAKLIFVETSKGKTSGTAEFEPTDDTYGTVVAEWNINNGKIECTYCMTTWYDRDGGDDESEADFNNEELQNEYDNLVDNYLPF